MLGSPARWLPFSDQGYVQIDSMVDGTSIAASKSQHGGMCGLTHSTHQIL